MKKTADNIRIIGKSDGPTSVFIAGKDKKKTLRQKIEKSMYDFRRKRVIKFLRADSHSVDEVADYVVRELGYTEVSPSDESYQTEYSRIVSVAISSGTAWRSHGAPKTTTVG